MDRNHHEGLSCLSVIIVRDFPFEGHKLNIVEVRHNGPHEGPSYSQQAITWSIVFHYYSRDVETAGGTTDSVVADKGTTEGV